jgi:TRAP-type C4-dicarboxylate transport system substrate-binding protein
VLAVPVVLRAKAQKPTAVFIPVVLHLNALKPTAVLFETLLHNKAHVPIAVLAEPELEKAGVKTLFYFSWPPQNLFGRGPQIKSIEEFAGRKFRTTDGKQSEMLKRLGGSAVSLTLAEVPLAVERGVVDGFMTAGFNVVGAKWSEFVNWGYIPGIHAGGPDYIMVNIDAYKKLKPEVRAVLDKVAAQWGPKMTRENAADETRDLEILKTKFKSFSIIFAFE